MDINMYKIINLLAKEFDFSEKAAIKFINSKIEDKKEISKEENEYLEKKDINLNIEYRKCTQEIINYQHCIPYCGVIYENLCKGIVYNHGLYTQCKKHVSGEFCTLCMKLKYGRIEDRKKFEIGKFITNNGKKEVDYEDYVKKAKLPIDDIKIFMSNNNLIYPFKNITDNEEKKQKRGRPVKDTKKEVSSKIDKADEMISNINNSKNVEEKSGVNKSVEEKPGQDKIQEEKSGVNKCVEEDPGQDKSGVVYLEDSESELEEELESIKIDGKTVYKTTSGDKEGFGYDNEGNVIVFNKELEVIGIIVDDNIRYI
jgi:hypothetical protein